MKMTIWKRKGHHKETDKKCKPRASLTKKPSMTHTDMKGNGRWGMTGGRRVNCKCGYKLQWDVGNFREYSILSIFIVQQLKDIYWITG